MIKQSLEGVWVLESDDALPITGTIPGSVYSFYFNAGLIENPHFRDNEMKALQMMERDYTFKKEFEVSERLLACERVELVCEGLDTICDLSINGQLFASVDNFHRTWRFDVKPMLRQGRNLLCASFASPTRWIAQKDSQWHVGGSYHAMRGFPHMRKPHCMFGWDWGPRLPDAGIWRPISLVGSRLSRLENVHIRQRHDQGRVMLLTEVSQTGDAEINIEIIAPNGRATHAKVGEWAEIQEPELWWPNGYGSQPLYRIQASLTHEGILLDACEKRVGLRTLSVARHQDEWGESFAHCINGVEIFAMGADYIPEDNLLSRVKPERTTKLLQQCVRANFNTVRVWGGGYYPDDWFYDTCDELGLLVWQDCMFACANYPLDDAFEENITQELRDNVRRLRHHASLAVWCGNNEMEQFEITGEFESQNISRAHYIRMYEHIIPHILSSEDPDTFYWPSSPSSGGSFEDPQNPNRGDVHYWDVWHGGKPFSDYRKHYFRYVSEFGFQAFPCMKTIESFTLAQDRNVFSRVMEMHQRNEGANGKILQYLSQTYLYPSTLDLLAYASQLLQADAIRCGVEHWRRHRGRCMGAIYWQLNDIWPVASWASVDYFGNWKALHYAAKRFFAPVMISNQDESELTQRFSVVQQPTKVVNAMRLCVTNETLYETNGVVQWQLRDAKSKILQQGQICLTVAPLSAVWCERHEFETIDILSDYLSYEYCIGNTVVSEGTSLFTAPKHFQFENPHLSVRQEENYIMVSADAFAKSVEILSDGETPLILSDNYFDMNAGERRVDILEGEVKNLRARSVFDIG